MINLFKLKKKQKDDEEKKQKDDENSEKNGANQTAKKKKKQTAGELRLLKDLSELKDVYESVSISFPNGADDVMNFQVLIIPDNIEGYYKGGQFLFSFQVPPIYPHEPPKVNCKTKIIHPNIDLEGKVCLNVLREDWSPVCNINIIVCGLFHLFTNPNFDDPLNHDAAAVLKQRAADGYVGRRLWQP